MSTESGIGNIAIVVTFSIVLGVIIYNASKKKDNKINWNNGYHTNDSLALPNIKINDNINDIEAYINRYSEALHYLFYEEKLNEYLAYYFIHVQEGIINNLRNSVGNKELANKPIPLEIYQNGNFLEILKNKVKLITGETVEFSDTNEAWRFFNKEILKKANGKVLDDLKDHIFGEKEQAKWHELKNDEPTSFRV